MSNRTGWWLFTDPHFEQTFEAMRSAGFRVSIVARDEFEDTVKSCGFYEVERLGRTILGTPFDTALDHKERVLLITADPPSTEIPPIEPFRGNIKPWTRDLPVLPMSTRLNDQLGIVKMLSVVAVEAKYALREWAQVQMEQARKKERYIR